MDTVTSLTLLEGLRDPENEEAWRRFSDRYRPMTIAFAAKLGLTEHDAQDAGQEAMLAFVTGYRQGAYDRAKGRLRSWLFGIAYRKVKDIQRTAGQERPLADRSDASAWLASVAAPDTAQAVWEQEWQRAVLRACMAEATGSFEPQTLRVFELYVLEEWPAKKVADYLGITRNAVFVAKNHVTSHLRELARQMEQIW